MDRSTAEAIQEINKILLTLNDSIENLLTACKQLNARVKKLEDRNKHK